MKSIKNLDSIFTEQNIRGILLDFDNTLYDYKPCHEAGLKAAYNLYNKNYKVSYKKFKELYSQAQIDVKLATHNQGASHSRLLYFQKMVEEKERTTKIQKIIKLEEVYWSHFQKKMKLREGLVDFLKKSRKIGYKICLVTDLTASVQFRKIASAGVDKLVDFIVTSEEAGSEKPNSAIFSLALDKMGLSKDEVVMIGDDNIKDIDGAHKLGIKAFLVQG